MFAKLLSRTPEPPPECETMPNFVANTTWSRRSLIARPVPEGLLCALDNQ
jgi:hypothetical protein